jgi:hypothetical protein
MFIIVMCWIARNVWIRRGINGQITATVGSNPAHPFSHITTEVSGKPATELILK